MCFLGGSNFRRLGLFGSGFARNARWPRGGGWNYLPICILSRMGWGRCSGSIWIFRKGVICLSVVPTAAKRGDSGRRGPVQELEVRRGPLSFPVARLREFRPDLVHITGPGDVSILGLWASHLVGAPMVASRHTNVHEYADLRVANCKPKSAELIQHG